MPAASRVSCWWAMPSRPPARPPAPGATRSSPTSSGSATSISRSGWPPTGWIQARSPPSTQTRSSGSATIGRPRRPSISAQSPLRQALIGRRSAGHASLPGRFRDYCGRLEQPSIWSRTSSVTPPHRPRRGRLHPRRLRRCPRRREPARHAVGGSGRSTACDRCRSWRAARHVSRARSPCPLKSR